MSVLLKSFDDVCGQENGWEYYETYDKEVYDDNEKYEKYEEDGGEHGGNEGNGV